MNTTTIEQTVPPANNLLTGEQVRFYDENGYLVIKQAVTGRLLERLRDASAAWVEQAARAAIAGEELPDFSFAQRPHGRTPYRVDYLYDKGYSAPLELLGHPRMLGIAESLCGRNFVPTYEAIVFKMEGDGEAVPWHQDAVFPRRYRVFNVGLYLDESRADGGALRVVPKSHRVKHDACQVQQEVAWDHPSILTVEMEPGDILIHDTMLLHGSPRTLGNALRRTIYYEFRPVEQILEEGPWDADWANARLQLIPIALAAYRRQFPEESQFEWRIDSEYKPAADREAEAQLRVPHIVHTPGSYCSAGGSI